MRNWVIRFVLLAGAAFTNVQFSLSQDTIRMEYGGYPVYGRIVDGDTILISNIQEATIRPPESFSSAREERQPVCFNGRRYF
jgi:hypothetical protein